MHAISSYRGNRAVHTQTQTGPITIIYTALQCNKFFHLALSAVVKIPLKIRG